MDVQSNTVASGGLGREVFIWDLEAAMVPVARAHNEANEEGGYEGGYSSGEHFCFTSCAFISIVLFFYFVSS